MTEHHIHEHFIALLESNIGIILKISKAYTNTAQDREDLINDIAFEMWKAFPNFKGNSKISTWVYRIALNTSMNYKRNSRRKKDFIQSEIAEITGISKTNVGTRISRIKEQLKNKCTMELEELKTIWSQHEKMLVENTVLNKQLLKKILTVNTGRRIDWLKVRSLVALILPLPLFIFIVIPRIQFTLEFDVVIGFLLFASISVITYAWAIKLYLRIERLNPNGPITNVSKQLKLVEKYKLKITRNGYILAPFMIVGVFLSAGIQFLSAKMIPFYALMVVVFLISMYVRSKHGLLAQIRKIDRDIEEISKLELDSEIAA